MSFVPQTFKAEFTSIKQHVLQQIDITCKPNFPVCCFEGGLSQAMVSNRETKIKQSEAGRWESNRLKADLTDSGFVWELLIHFNVHHGQGRHWTNLPWISWIVLYICYIYACCDQHLFLYKIYRMHWGLDPVCVWQACRQVGRLVGSHFGSGAPIPSHGCRLSPTCLGPNTGPGLGSNPPDTVTKRIPAPPLWYLQKQQVLCGI